MAPANLLLIRGENVIAEGINLALSLKSAKLPVNQDAYEDFSPSVANGSTDIAVSSDALELAFTTTGIQPELLAQCNRAFGWRGKYTLYGALVDEYATDASTRIQQVEATAIGRLNAEVSDNERKSVGGTDYTVKSIIKYTLRIAGIEICRFDLKNGGWIDRDGQRSEIAQMIALTA